MKHTMVLAFLPVLFGAGLAAAQPAMPPPAAPEGLMELSTKAREARLKGEVPNWLSFATRTLALTPEHPDILISVARANAAAGNKAAAFDYLAQAGRRGAGVDAARLPEFKALVGDPAFEAAAAAAKRNLTPVAKAVTFAEHGDRKSEGIA